jgi:ABC-type uncharacterized transport system permease subunit
VTLDRFLRYQTLLGVLSPLVAVVLAFVVGGVVILVFIKSYVFSPGALDALATRGLPAEVGERLQPLKGREFPNRSAFEKAVRSAVGDEAHER